MDIDKQKKKERDQLPLGSWNIREHIIKHVEDVIEHVCFGSNPRVPVRLLHSREAREAREARTAVCISMVVVVLCSSMAVPDLLSALINELKGHFRPASAYRFLLYSEDIAETIRMT
jgi:hypothetical protein